jgi:hypothetical protein
VGWAVARSGERIMVGVPGRAIANHPGAGGVLIFDFASDVQRDGFEGGAPGCD